MPTGGGLESGSSLATINEEERRNRRQGTALAIDGTETCNAEALGDASDPQEEGSLGKENWSKVFEAESGPAKDHCGRLLTPCRCAVDIQPKLHLHGTSLLCRILVKKHQ